MKIIDIFTTANQNLTRSKLRTSLTVLSIVIGTFTLALSLGLGEGVRKYITSQLGDYQDVNLYRVTKAGADGGGGPTFNTNPVEHTGSETAKGDITQALLTEVDIAKIQSADGVKSIYRPYTPAIEYLSGSDGKQYNATAYTVIPETNQNIIYGKSPNDSDTGKLSISSKFASIVGASSQKDMLGKTIQLAIKSVDNTVVFRQYEIVGVFNPTIVDSTVKLTERDAKELLTLQTIRDPNIFFDVFVSKTDQVDDAKLKDNLKAIKYSAGSFKDLFNTLSTIVTGVQIGLGAFSAIAIFASIIGVVNTLFMAVLERTREIGLYRSMGAKRKTIFALFSFEAAFIGFWGGAIGLIVSNIAQLFINRIAANTFLEGVEGFTLLHLTPPLMFIIIVSMMILTLLAGLFPSIKASRQDPIKALRYE